MKRTSQALPPIEWEVVSVFEQIPQPFASEDNSEFSWRLFDAAVRAAEQWVAQQPKPMTRGKA